jgi:(p)ppGpp synthase/HD superfamily hydrolase
VTIHRKGCQNLKYLEPERLIRAEWQDSLVSNFVTVIKVHADISSAVVNALNKLARDLKNKLKGFGYKEIKDEYVFEIVAIVTNKAELESLIKNCESVKGVRKVYRSE